VGPCAASCSASAASPKPAPAVIRPPVRVRPLEPRGRAGRALLSDARLFCLCARPRRDAGRSLSYAQPSLTKKAAPPRAQRRPPALRARGSRHLARQRRRPPGRARPRTPSRDRLPTHRARLPRHAGEQDGRGRDTGTRTFRPSKRQAARQGIGPRPCALARRHPRPPRTLARSDQRVQRALDFHPSSEASVRRLVCMTLASTRESGRELTRSRLADEPRAASMLAARGPAPAGHAEHAEH
jgi:hypothetical protein